MQRVPFGLLRRVSPDRSAPCLSLSQEPARGPRACWTTIRIATAAAQRLRSTCSIDGFLGPVAPFRRGSVSITGRGWFQSPCCDGTFGRFVGFSERNVARFSPMASTSRWTCLCASEKWVWPSKPPAEALDVSYTLPCILWHNVVMNAANAQIGEWLGVKAPTTDTEILDIVEKQLAPAVIKRLLALGLERSEIDEIIIPQRTLQHRRSRREKLTVEESDRVLRAIRVLSRTEAVYGTRERALAWLRRPNTRLDGRTPLSLLKTDTGSRIAEELLVQIDEGMFV
jgi:putative toxin-antitoxin system antitoxin component (TIGR02293 family)